MDDLRKFLKVFDLAPTASLEDVKKGYRKMVRDWHPDLIKNDEGLKRIAEEKIKEINIAYDFLCRHFARKIAGYQDEKGQSVEPIVCQILEKDSYLINLDQERIFPVLFEAFFQFGMINITWNTYQRFFCGRIQESVMDPSQNKDIKVTLKEHAGKTKVKVDFKFSNYAENIKLGFVEGPDLSVPIKKFLLSPKFHEEIRPNLTSLYFQNFHLHDITVSEIQSRKILIKTEEDALEFQGISVNQLLNLIYLSFLDCKVENISWNTFDQVIQGNTGWSIRSCGQKVYANLEGERKFFKVKIRSEPMQFTGKTSKINDLGRGKDEIRAIISRIVSRISS